MEKSCLLAAYGATTRRKKIVVPRSILAEKKGELPTLPIEWSNYNILCSSVCNLSSVLKHTFITIKLLYWTFPFVVPFFQCESFMVLRVYLTYGKMLHVVPAKQSEHFMSALQEPSRINVTCSTNQTIRAQNGRIAGVVWNFTGGSETVRSSIARFCSNDTFQALNVRSAGAF